MPVNSIKIDVDEDGTKRTVEIDIQEQDLYRFVDKNGNAYTKVRLGMVYGWAIPKPADIFITFVSDIRDKLIGRGYNDIWFEIDYGADIVEYYNTDIETYLNFGACKGIEDSA